MLSVSASLCISGWLHATAGVVSGVRIAMVHEDRLQKPLIITGNRSELEMDCQFVQHLEISRRQAGQCQGRPMASAEEQWCGCTRHAQDFDGRPC